MIGWKPLWRGLAPITFVFWCVACTADTTAPAAAPEASSDAQPRVADIIRNPVAETGVAPDSAAVARMDFALTTYEFGQVAQGTVVEHTFTFTNSGSQPLLITDARSTCGCTVGEYPDRAIPPGGSGEIKVSFNTAHKYGRQRKPVMLTANTYPARTTVYLDGHVLTPDNQ